MILGYMFFVSGVDSKIRFKTYYQSYSDVNYKINYDNIDDGVFSVKDINFDYKYNSIFTENMNGYYKFDVVAYLYACEDDIEDILWFRKYNLVDSKILDVDNNENVEFRDSFNLDYQKYKEDLGEFINSQEIDVLGYLNIKINVSEYLNVNENIKNRTIDIIVPVSEVSKIDIDNINVRDSYYDFNNHSILNFVLVTLSMLCFSFMILLLFLVIRQFKFISDRQSKYSLFLKNILNKYDFCIVKVNKMIVSKKYNMIYVSSFSELLDVYNTTNKMINFKEVERGSESIFVIIDSCDAWIYRLTSDNVE